MEADMVTTTGGIKLASCRSSLSRSLRAAVIDFRLYINYLYSTATSSFSRGLLYTDHRIPPASLYDHGCTNGGIL